MYFPMEQNLSCCSTVTVYHNSAFFSFIKKWFNPTPPADNDPQQNNDTQH